MRPHPLPVPRVSHVFAEAGLLYKLVVIKNIFAASDEVISFRINDQSYSLIGFNQYVIKTRCTRGVRVVSSVTRMRSSNSARINKFDFRTEKSCSVHMTVFEIVAGHNVVNWMQLLT